jgi:hypothetical protein
MHAPAKSSLPLLPNDDSHRENRESHCNIRHIRREFVLEDNTGEGRRGTELGDLENR